MDFTGPYRELLQRMYDRCVQMKWFGPENAARHRRHQSYALTEYRYKGFLPKEEIQRQFAQFDTYDYTYSEESEDGEKHTIVRFTRDMRDQRFAYAPATPNQIAYTEAAIGFPLPQLLRDIYTQLANGGFGRWGGFVGVQGGAFAPALKTIDVFTAHASWKLTDKAPNDLVEQSDVFKCMELPDRFMPWGGDDIWIDGWTGCLYVCGIYSLYEYDSPEEMLSDELFHIEPRENAPMTSYANWEHEDRSEGYYIDANVDELDDPEAEGLGYNLCYGIQYEAPSLEAWIERWLATNPK